jgi:hypothetical protein
MTGQLAVGELLRARIPPWSGARNWKIFAASPIYENLCAPGLIEAEFFFALDLHYSRILDNDLDRAETNSADRVCDSAQDFVLVVPIRFRLRVDLDGVGYSSVRFHNLSY